MLTVEVETKLVPVIVRPNPDPPAMPTAGFSIVIDGTGLGVGRIVNWSGAVVPPPGSGVKTVTFAVPGFWTNEAGIWAVISVWLMKMDVVSGVAVPPVAVPDHSTMEVGAKLLPITISVKSGLPAAMLGGCSDALAGDGLLMYSPQLGRLPAVMIRATNKKRDFPNKISTPEPVGRCP